MARKRGGGNFRKYLSGAIDEKLDIGTLAGQTLVGATMASTVVDTTRISSIECTWALNDVTPKQNQGPLIVGVAHSDYTDAEVEEWLESTGGWDIGNKNAQERRNRLVRQVGVMPEPEALENSVVLNDGKPIKTKLNWVLAEGDTLRLWAYNAGSGAYATTAPKLIVNGKANLWAQ